MNEQDVGKRAVELLKEIYTLFNLKGSINIDYEPELEEKICDILRDDGKLSG